MTGVKPVRTLPVQRGAMTPLGVGGGTKARLILVDDDAAVRSALSFALSSEGYRIQTYADAETMLAQAPPADCFIVDDRLPGGMSGLELVRRLRAGGTMTPAILMTTNPELRLVTEARRLGIPIVEKPLLGPDLSNTISTLLVVRGQTRP